MRKLIFFKLKNFIELMNKFSILVKEFITYFFSKLYEASQLNKCFLFSPVYLQQNK